MSKPVSRYSRNSNQFLQLLGVRSSAVEEGRDLNIGSFHSVGHVKNVPKMVIRVMNERLYLAKKCVHRWVLYIFFKMQIPPLSFRYNIEFFFGFTAVHKSRCIFAATGIFLINVKFYSSSHLRNPINTLQILAQEKKGLFLNNVARNMCCCHSVRPNNGIRYRVVSRSKITFRSCTMLPHPSYIPSRPKEPGRQRPLKIEYSMKFYSSFS